MIRCKFWGGFETEVGGEAGHANVAMGATICLLFSLLWLKTGFVLLFFLCSFQQGPVSLWESSLTNRLLFAAVISSAHWTGWGSNGIPMYILHRPRSSSSRFRLPVVAEMKSILLGRPFGEGDRLAVRGTVVCTYQVWLGMWLSSFFWLYKAFSGLFLHWKRVITNPRVAANDNWLISWWEFSLKVLIFFAGSHFFKGTLHQQD